MNEYYFSGEWEHVNADLRRIKVPGGWVVVTTVNLIVGGKEYHASSQPLLIPDPHYDWRIRAK